MPHIGVSSTLGKGFEKILPKTEILKKEYFEVFLPELMGNKGGAPEEEQEFEPINPIKLQSMPTSAVGPDKEVLATQAVQESADQAMEDVPAEGDHPLEQLD